MLSAAQIATMQAISQTLTMTTPCTISRKAEVSDGAGGQTDTWNTVATTVCSVAPALATDNEEIQELRLGLVSGWIIGLPVGTDVTILDRIVANGITYEVNNIRAPRTIQIAVDCVCSRVQ